MPIATRDRVRWFVLAGGAALLIALFVQIGPARVTMLLAALGANFLVIVAAFSCHEGVRAVALGLCIGPADRPAYTQLLRVRFLGELAGALTRTGPFAAEPTRAFALARRAGAAEAVGAAASELIANSLMSAVVTVCVVWACLWTHSVHGSLRALSYILLWASLGFLVTAVSALVSRTYIIGAIVKRAGAIPLIGRRLKADPAQVRKMEDAIITALTRNRTTLVRIALLELSAQCILVFEIYWTIRSMGIPIAAASALLVEVLIKAPNIIQFIGATEGGYALVFNWMGMTAAVGFTLSLVRLLRSLSACAIGLSLLAQIERPWFARRRAPDGTAI